MKPGPRKTPTVLRALRGNPDKRPMPVNEPVALGELAEPPAYFDEEQRDAWHYALEHAPLGLLKSIDRELLAAWCVASVEFQRAVVQVRRMGQVVKTRDGNAIQNPYLPVMNRQLTNMLRLADHLGFSPSSRASLGNVRMPAGDGPGLSTPSQPRSALGLFLQQKPTPLQ